MPKPYTEPSDSYLECSRLLRRLHGLIREGRGESQEADGVRDAMDSPWAMLSEREAGLVRTLSADLATIGQGAPGEWKTLPNDSPRLVELREAEAGRDWVRFLDLVRDSRDFIDPSTAAYIR